VLAGLTLLLAAPPGWADRGEAVAVAVDVRELFAGEISDESTGMLVWGITAVVSAGYAAAVFSGHAHGASVLTYLSVAGVAGGATRVGAGAWRQHELRGLERRLDEDLARPADAGPVLLPPTTTAVGAELRRMDTALHQESEGALRAGCVVPVLLSGIGLYGLLLDEPAGQQLAGVTLGGAMVIGVPSMLSYWGLSGRVDRMDRLLRRWSENLEPGGANRR
jgi:hypothetical protein